MKKQVECELKPEGWSYHWARRMSRTGFRWGVWGGTLDIPQEGFREWFIRVPLIGLTLTLTHVAA